MLLSEVLNQPYRYSLRKSGQREYNGKFSTKDNAEVLVDFEFFDEEWEIIFTTSDNHRFEPYTPTDKRDSFRIFATVLMMIKEFIDKESPKIIQFSAKEDSRHKLYQSMIKKYAPKWGYKLGYQGGDLFFLEKIK